MSGVEILVGLGCLAFGLEIVVALFSGGNFAPDEDGVPQFNGYADHEIERAFNCAERILAEERKRVAVDRSKAEPTVMPSAGRRRS